MNHWCFEHSSNCNFFQYHFEYHYYAISQVYLKHMSKIKLIFLSKPFSSKTSVNASIAFPFAQARNLEDILALFLFPPIPTLCDFTSWGLSGPFFCLSLDCHSVVSFLDFTVVSGMICTSHPVPHSNPILPHEAFRMSWLQPIVLAHPLKVDTVWMSIKGLGLIDLPSP